MINQVKVRDLFFIALMCGAIVVGGFGSIGEMRAGNTDNPSVDYKPNLPITYIEAAESIPGKPGVPCTIKMVCPKGFERFNTGLLSGRIEIRGGVSRGYPKKSYNFELDKPVRLLDMRKDDDWILTSSYIDRALIRIKLSFDLFKSLSERRKKRFAVDSRCVEVYLNEEYHGVYLLMERLDAKLLKLQKYNSEDAYHSCSYKAVNHAANFAESGHLGYIQKAPKKSEQAYWEPMDEFNQFVISSTDEQFFHPKTGIRSRLDIKNAIDFHLTVLVTSNYDGITKNFYFSRDGQKTGTIRKRFFFAPWDYDGTFGRNWNATVTGHSDWLTNNLFNRLLRNEAYRKQFIARWNHLHKRQFSVKAIHALIDQYVKTLGKATPRNFVRWPTNAPIYPDSANFEEDIAYIKSWTEARINWLHQEINQNLNQRY